MEDIAEKVLAARLRLNWSMRRLAREAGVGLDVVRRLESGGKIWAYKLAAIVTVLNYGTQAK